MLGRLKSLWVTYLLLAIMIIVYLGMVLNGGASSTVNLIRFGAKINPLIQDGQYWRLVTPIFIHLNFTHILFNGITLYYLGRLLENLWGHFRFLFLFMLSGICGNVASFAFSNSISAGASTALFGLFGAFLLVGISFWHRPGVKRITQEILFFLILNLGSDLIIPGIDLAGHLGGLISGYLGAYIIGLRYYQKPRIRRIGAGILLLLLIVGSLYLGFFG